MRELLYSQAVTPSTTPELEQPWAKVSQGSSLDSALGGSSDAKFVFQPSTHFRGARAAGPQQYWQSGSYGILTVTDGVGQSYLWM